MAKSLPPMVTMTGDALAYASIESIAAMFRRRMLSPVELAKFHLARLERLNPELNAFLAITGDLALKQARKAESELFAPHRGKRVDRGPLHGIPISLKDNIYTKDIRTTAGSKILKDFIPLHDARIVAQLKEAGAVLLGKTNLHEFAYGVTTTNPHFGATRNPWDLARIPGGSSGGSAAAVAAGIGYGSFGTDTGGSIRIPSSLCGTVGVKPGLGRVSLDGIVPLSKSLDFAGPIARSVSDATALLHAVFAYRKGESKLAVAGTRKAPRRKFVLGVPKEFFFDVITSEVGDAFRAAMAAFRELGVKGKTVSIPSLPETEEAGNLIAWAEATEYHEQAGWFPSLIRQYGADVRTRLEVGAKVSATSYIRAMEFRDRFAAEFARALRDAEVDALLVPTTPIGAPLIGEESTRIGKEEHPTRALLLRLNRPANVAGVPAISLPCGQTSLGLPIGLQLIGLPEREADLLQIARAFESSQPPAEHPLL